MALRYVKKADVQGADALAYDDEQSEALAVFLAPPRKSTRRVVRVREGLSQELLLDKLDASALSELATQVSLPVDQRGLLREAALHLYR